MSSDKTKQEPLPLDAISDVDAFVASLEETLESVRESRTHARRTDPDTSHEAARKIAKQTESQRRVLRILERHSEGLTDAELLYEWRRTHGPVPESTPRKRRCDLVRMGKVFDAGRRIVDGSRRIVWHAKK
jgi:hypothetical protein